jgi:hypothetical protein
VHRQENRVRQPKPGNEFTRWQLGCTGPAQIYSELWRGERWEPDTRSAHKDHEQKRNGERKKTESKEEKSRGARYGSQSQIDRTRPAPRSEQKTINKITTAQLARETSWATKSRRHRKSQRGTTSGKRTPEQRIHRGFNEKKPQDLAAQKSKGRKCKI